MKWKGFQLTLMKGSDEAAKTKTNRLPKAKNIRLLIFIV